MLCGLYILMVTKKNKLGILPKIYWAQVPGNKCVEFIIVHPQRISAVMLPGEAQVLLLRIT